MQNRLFYSIAILLTATSVFFQKYDYNWLVGYDSAIPQNLYYGVSNIHFQSGHAEVDYVAETPINIDNYTTTMSDKAGNLLFYTNGCYILNAQHQIIENGDSLNPGSAFDEWCGPISFPAYRGMQGAFALPAPGNDSLYFAGSLSWSIERFMSTKRHTHISRLWITLFLYRASRLQ